ncbi:Erg28 protein [Schizosaccharomyces japonicus yFS275]|uniref:Erg28 protein n=1 Tax=Schizosaccharomyces japonicus (strain yFS275 / FY16936) TaxID=402676 RepID=B6JVN8_SCHJY|nr:Erg28 protein [Schizosaccharomyces japonicus yFS275]EEB05439.1 Erg28 protein [Schizosaccharomyces japonicus yFS275]
MFSIINSLPAGLLPKWMFIVGLTAVFNTVQSFLTPKLTKRVYSNTNEVNGLQGRTFGIWTLTSAVVRLYGAFHLNDPHVYFLCQATYYIACLHFLLEWMAFRTTAMGPGLASPIIVSTMSIVWMALQKDAYVGKLASY